MTILLTTKPPISLLRHCVMTTLFLVCSIQAFGQEAGGSNETSLFSPPQATSASGDGSAHDRLLPMTTEQIGNSDANPPIYGSVPPPNIDVANETPVARPPQLISTPSAASSDNSAFNNSTAPRKAKGLSGPQEDGWGSNESYQRGLSLWGQTNAAPVPQPTMSNAPSFEAAQFPAGAYNEPVCGGPVYGEPVVSDTGCYVGGEAIGYVANSTGSGVGRYWGGIDFLLWNMNGYATPALVTRAPGNVVQNASGALGGSGTQILYGNRRLGDDLRLGGRMQFGRWFDRCKGVGLQVDFFGLAGDSQSTVFTGNNTDIYARPFFNTDPNVNAEDGLVFSMPGIADGSVRFDLSSEVWSAGTAFRMNVGGSDTGSHRVDLLVGYRYFRLEESFSARGNLGPDDPMFSSGTRLDLNDRVRTRNDFHGVELGLNHVAQRGSWMWDVSALCAFGEVERVVDLTGTTRVVIPGDRDDTYPGGFFSGPRDIGRFRDNDFAAIPQVRANLSYCLRNNWRMSVGYNFAFLSSAFRPGQFLNTTFDGNRIGQNASANLTQRPVFRRDNLILHGANVGLTYNF